MGNSHEFSARISADLIETLPPPSLLRPYLLQSQATQSTSVIAELTYEEHTSSEALVHSPDETLLETSSRTSPSSTHLLRPFTAARKSQAAAAAGVSGAGEAPGASPAQHNPQGVQAAGSSPESPASPPRKTPDREKATQSNWSRNSLSVSSMPGARWRPAAPPSSSHVTAGSNSSSLRPHAEALLSGEPTPTSPARPRGEPVAMTTPTVTHLTADAKRNVLTEAAAVAAARYTSRGGVTQPGEEYSTAVAGGGAANGTYSGRRNFMPKVCGSMHARARKSCGSTPLPRRYSYIGVPGCPL